MKEIKRRGFLWTLAGAIAVPNLSGPGVVKPINVPLTGDESQDGGYVPRSNRWIVRATRDVSRNFYRTLSKAGYKTELVEYSRRGHIKVNVPHGSGWGPRLIGTTLANKVMSLGWRVIEIPRLPEGLGQYAVLRSEEFGIAVRGIRQHDMLTDDPMVRFDVLGGKS